LLKRSAYLCRALPLTFSKAHVWEWTIVEWSICGFEKVRYFTCHFRQRKKPVDSIKDILFLKGCDKPNFFKTPYHKSL
jgi:hypothetical protein